MCTSGDVLQAHAFGGHRFARLGVGNGRLYERLEQWMAFSRRGGKFRMKLAGNKPGMIRQFDHFAQTVLDRHTAHAQASLPDAREVMIVDLIAMTMTFTDAP